MINAHWIDNVLGIADLRTFQLARGFTAILVAFLLAIITADVAQAEHGGKNFDTPFEQTEDRVRCENYVATRQPLFGTTHLHTGLSFDASIRFVKYSEGNNPRGAYRFAQQKSSIILPDPVGIQGEPSPFRRPTIDRPLDWGGVTDHSETFGEMGICKNFLGRFVPGRTSMECRMLNGFYWGPDVLPDNEFQTELASNALPLLTVPSNGPSSLNTNLPLCMDNPEICQAGELAVWEEVQAAAEDEYDRSSRCSFTTFVAYEVTSTPASTNWHRNVFFRNSKVVRKPVTAVDMAVRPNRRPVFRPPSYLGGRIPRNDDGAYPLPAGSFWDHPLPERLWNRLDEDCLMGANTTYSPDTRCDVLTIPHNSNLGGGIGGIPAMFYEPFNAEDARRRAMFEPLVEIYQNKGSSECRWDPRFAYGIPNNPDAGVGGTTDEFCNFELLDSDSLTSASGVGGCRWNHDLQLFIDESGMDCGFVVNRAEDGAVDLGVGDSPPAPPTAYKPAAYVRNVLKDGIKYAAGDKFEGVNPFKLGIVSASDSHNGVMGWHPEDETFPGHLGVDDAYPTSRPSTIQNGSGGHSVVWAEENSRDSIFEALRRKETYGTSGTRPVVRFFGGWDFPRNMCRTDFVAKSYEDGVPMGGDLPARPDGAGAPTFILAAWMDDFVGTPLEQIQIIKGWVEVEADGQITTHEKVYKVKGAKGDANAPEDNRKFSVDSCEYTGNRHAALCKVWTDPDFDSEQHAFYYGRVLERPVCRWSTRWCRTHVGVDPLSPTCQDDLNNMTREDAGFEQNRKAKIGASCCNNITTAPIVQPVIQERAWTSPIWYTPNG